MSKQESQAIQQLQPSMFVKGIIGSDTVLDDPTRKHIAFIGRSNVGKSSVINAILERKNLVKSSARPGKTTEINFFTVGEDYYFVDLPGYGFARMGEKQREKLRKLILWYLLHAGIEKRKTFLVIDAQVGVTDFDEQIIEELVNTGEDISLIINKIDKLNQQQRHRLQSTIQEQYNIPCFWVSARTKRGVGLIQEEIAQ